MANQLLHFVKLNRRERINQRNKTERASVSFDWSELTKHYNQAYSMALASR